MKFYTNEVEALALSIENEYLIRKYEVIILPSLGRNMIAFDALKYASLLLENRQAFNRFNGILEGHCEYLWAQTEFEWYCSLAANPYFRESELRVVAVGIYANYIRSQQILENMGGDR